MLTKILEYLRQLELEIGNDARVTIELSDNGLYLQVRWLPNDRRLSCWYRFKISEVELRNIRGGDDHVKSMFVQNAIYEYQKVITKFENEYGPIEELKPVCVYKKE